MFHACVARLDVFSISGRGTVATGRVERGTITKGAEIEVVGMGPSFKTILTGIEMFHKEVRTGFYIFNWLFSC